MGGWGEGWLGGGGMGGWGEGWLGGGGWVDGVRGGWGVPPTHVHMHTHARMHTHAHIHIKHDNFNCKWQPPLGESLGIPYDVIHTHACMRVHVHVCGEHPHPTLHPHPPTPHPPGGETPESVKIQ